jgi:hypothetical protein
MQKVGIRNLSLTNFTFCANYFETSAAMNSLLSDDTANSRFLLKSYSTGFICNLSITSFLLGLLPAPKESWGNPGGYEMELSDVYI